MIPKIIHFCWLSGNKHPKMVKRCIQSWKSKLPDYEFILWDTNRFDINSTLWTKQAFEVKKYAFAADYIRLYAVYHYGGIYLDMDVQVLKKFDDLLDLPYFIGNQYDNFIEAAVFGAEKNSSWVLDCLKYYENRSFINKDGSFDTNILPAIIESQVKKTRKISLLKSSEFKNISKLISNESVFYLFDSEYFSPKNFQTNKILSTHKTYTIHHYNSSWFSFMSKQLKTLGRWFGVDKAEKIITFLAIRKVVNKMRLLLNNLKI